MPLTTLTSYLSIHGMKAAIQVIPMLALLAMGAPQPATAQDAQEAGAAPSIQFNVLRLHAGTDQPLSITASDPDGTISEIRARLMEKDPGAASPDTVWEKSIFGKESSSLVMRHWPA